MKDKDIKMVDVTLHIDEEIGLDQREKLRDTVLGNDGVMAAAIQLKTPHVMIVEYDPDRVTSAQLLEMVTATGVHAELSGF